MKVCASIWLVGMLLFFGGTAPVSPVPVVAPTNTVTHEIGPTLAGVMTLIVLQGVAVLTAYMAYRRAAATEKKAEAIEAKTGAIEAKVEATAAVQKEASDKADESLKEIHGEVNSKYGNLERKFDDSQSQVMELIKQLAAANATVVANAAAMATAPAAIAAPSAIGSVPVPVAAMQVDAEHVTVVPKIDAEDVHGG